MDLKALYFIKMDTRIKPMYLSNPMDGYDFYTEHNKDFIKGSFTNVQECIDQNRRKTERIFNTVTKLLCRQY